MKTRLIGTLLARDEEEIIGQNIEHHLSNGVDGFIVTLHQSRDKTPEIVKSFGDRILDVFYEEEPGYYQEQWVNRMASYASNKYDPEWLVHIDADEFWENLDTVFAQPPAVGLVIVDKIYNYKPTAKVEFGIFDPTLYTEYTQWEVTKVVHRPCQGMWVQQGNHSAVMHKGEKAYCDKISIRHYPMRSYQHFETKVAQGGKAYEDAPDLHPNFGQHWRDWYKMWKKNPEDLKKFYEQYWLVKE